MIWNFDDLLQYAEGDIAPVFNKRLSGTHPPWQLVDSFRRRVRLPQREYLLCSRVTEMQATTGKFEPCSMVTHAPCPSVPLPLCPSVSLPLCVSAPLSLCVCVPPVCVCVCVYPYLYLCVVSSQTAYLLTGHRV